MGATQSTNSSYLSQYASTTESSDCSAKVNQSIDNDNIVLSNIQCGGDINVGTQKVASNVNCQSDMNATIAAKAASMQSAKAVEGFLGVGSSKASNSVDLQQSMATHLAARCSADVNQEILNTPFTLSNIKAKGDCKILQQGADSKFACVHNAMSSIDMSATTQQKAIAKNQGALGALIMIFLICVAVFVLPEVGLSFLIPKAHKDFEGMQLNDMAQKCAQLKGKLAALKKGA